MTWVLILSSDDSGKHPAVVGGYPTREEAELAGISGTAYEAPDATGLQLMPFYNRYMVIPGSGGREPAGTTHSRVLREFEGERRNLLTRTTMRYPTEGLTNG